MDEYLPPVTKFTVCISMVLVSDSYSCILSRVRQHDGKNGHKYKRLPKFSAVDHSNGGNLTKHRLLHTFFRSQQYFLVPT